jgi:sterol desaturase/sphingolipid hydroxylase (fatty acid hydroxylase superfamily)
MLRERDAGMDELKYGTRDKRGDYRPNDPLKVGALLDFPWSLWRVIKWLPGFLLPWNALFMLLGIGLWFFATPSKETLATLNWDWAILLLVRNALIVLVVFGTLELVLYAKRRQGHRFKYNTKFPTDTPSDVFMFQSQNIDNIIRTFGTGLPIWTAYEVLMLHAWATGFGPWVLFGDNPVWLVVFWLIIPLIHDLHFFCIHLLIHQGPLYRWIHKVHHNSVNPSPWSSLSMHPVEHLLYWSDSLIHLILPSHPLLLLYHLQTTGTGAVIGHVGFDRVEAGDETSCQTHAFAHYLHHKYFEVNYADGSLPLDKWFGTWHDGTKEGDQKMRARFKRKKERMNRK